MTLCKTWVTRRWIRFRLWRERLVMTTLWCLTRQHFPSKFIKPCPNLTSKGKGTRKFLSDMKVDLVKHILKKKNLWKDTQRECMKVIFSSGVIQKLCLTTFRNKLSRQGRFSILLWNNRSQRLNFEAFQFRRLLSNRY